VLFIKSSNFGTMLEPPYIFGAKCQPG